MNTEAQNCLITSRDVRHMIGNVSDMTLWRWMNDKGYESLAFPKPVKINTRNYWDINTMREWIASQAV